MNEQSTLESFLRSKAAAGIKKEETTDWQKRKESWINSLYELYRNVQSWLALLEEDGTVQSKMSSGSRSEGKIGSYQIDELTLLIGNQEIRFIPKATLIIGAEGRVDIRGNAGVRSLILDKGQWFIVDRKPRLEIFPFNEDSFQDVLRDIME